MNISQVASKKKIKRKSKSKQKSIKRKSSKRGLNDTMMEVEDKREDPDYTPMWYHKDIKVTRERKVYIMISL